MSTFSPSPPPLPPPGFYRRFIDDPATIAECGGPCVAGGPEACDCGTLWEDRPWEGPPAAVIAQQVAARTWGLVLASLDDRIAELQRRRDAHLDQRDDLVAQASTPWDGAQSVAIPRLHAIDREVALQTWWRVLFSFNNRIAELQRQRDEHLAQRDAWIRQAIGESEPPQPPA